jgi:hypothetical protein
MRVERRNLWLAILIGAGTWIVLAATARGIPLIWDEPEYLFRADRILTWLRLLTDVGNPQGGVHALSSIVIHQYWWFTDSVEGHPAWGGALIALGKALGGDRLHPLTAARAVPVAVFSIACGAVAFRLKRDEGTVAAIAAPAAVLTLPRLFADAHFAALDGQLTAWWLLLWVVDAAPGRSTRKAIGVGILLGLTGATKFTGWFALGPIVASRAIDNDRSAIRELLTIVTAALAAFVVVNPPLWSTPVAGLVAYFRLNVGLQDANFFGVAQATRPPIVLRDYLFGGMQYGPLHPYLPWYNTLAWLTLATPLPTLVLGIIGLVDAVRRRVILLPLHWVTLMILRALPGAPPYDGIRLFLPAFAFWCVLSGVGAERVWDWSVRRGDAWRPRLAAAGLVAAFAAAAFNLSRYYPQALSHYSVVAGGLRGAASLGLEPTYWWDALDDDVLGWLNDHTRRGGAVAFSEIDGSHEWLLHHWGRLQPEVTSTDDGPFTWYVLQNRPSLLGDVDRALMGKETPAFVKYPGHHTDRVPADLKVPLILVFSYEQYIRASAIAGARR